MSWQDSYNNRKVSKKYSGKSGIIKHVVRQVLAWRKRSPTTITARLHERNIFNSCNGRERRWLTTREKTHDCARHMKEDEDDNEQVNSLAVVGKHDKIGFSRRYGDGGRRLRWRCSSTGKAKVRESEWRGSRHKERRTLGIWWIFSETLVVMAEWHWEKTLSMQGLVRWISQTRQLPVNTRKVRKKRKRHEEGERKKERKRVWLTSADICQWSRRVSTRVDESLWYRHMSDNNGVRGGYIQKTRARNHGVKRSRRKHYERVRCHG